MIDVDNQNIIITDEDEYSDEDEFDGEDDGGGEDESDDEDGGDEDEDTDENELVILNSSFEKFCEERNIKKNTIKGYSYPLKDYCKYQNATIDELIEEAIAEEREAIPLSDRRLRQRLLDYRNHLLKEGKSAHTQQTYLSKVKTFYKHNNIQLPILPRFKYEKAYQSSFSDLPTKDDIKRALGVSKIDMKALILFMSSSGTAKAETLSLTVGDFISACGDYSPTKPIDEILDELEKVRNLVPTFYLKRIKTDKYYYTFCSPEASSAIIEYLKTRKNLRLTDKLFNFPRQSLFHNFQAINDTFGWGFKGTYRFFRSHTLRKFHASNIGLNLQDIDALQGRAKSKVHEAYVKTNPDKLKELYVGAMHNVMIFNNRVSDNDNKQEFNITINVFLSGKEFNVI